MNPCQHYLPELSISNKQNIIEINNRQPNIDNDQLRVLLKGYGKGHGVRILPVDINRSQARCMVEDGRIRLGFRYVKEMGEPADANETQEQEEQLAR